MFRANSPYSPFFTSGLLSEPLSPHRLQDGHSAICLDVVFSDDEHYRSFLSLDLAETMSARSHSLKHTRPYCRHHMSKTSSRSSLRSIPSPKPIPSTTLPPPPAHFTRSPPVPTVPPRLPSLPVLPSLELDVSLRRSVSSQKRPFSFYPATRQSSVASSHTRLRNRANALALLEGRHRPLVPSLARPSRQPENFMSMSDDEDDDEDEDKSASQPLSDLEDELVHSFDPSYEPEDIVLPVSSPRSSLPFGVVRNKHRVSKHGHNLARRRSKHRSGGKARDWFPLKSFIDFYNENDEDAASANWNWRSFIEFSAVS